MRALLVYPTHVNCHEVAGELCDEGIDAVCYPARRTSPSTHQPMNCWNKDADRAEQYGLPVLKSVCLACDHRVRCQNQGYLGQLREASEAHVALATHQRAAASGIAELARESTYISIHENAVDLLRPTCRIEEPELVVFKRVISDLLNDPAWLDWFGNDLNKDDDGNEVHNAEQKVQRERLYQTMIALVQMLEALLAAMQKAETTSAWPLPDPVNLPARFERLLFRSLVQARAKLGSEVCQFAVAALAGELATAAIVVNNLFMDRSQGPGRRKVKVALGVRRTNVPAGRTIWFSDSTANPERMSRLVGIPVYDKTPDGTVPLQKKAIQYLQDVTGKSSAGVVCSLLRGTLARYSNRDRLGLITHRSQLKAIQHLEEDQQRRIVESTYFHSGEDRSSNFWHERCDLLLVLGTPRVPPAAVAEYLIQVGELDAASSEPAWGTLYWCGENEQGATVQVEGRGYQSDAWRTAHRDLVRSSLVQAIGRGRGILETGCDVIVFSTEECGLVIASEPCPWISPTAARIWFALRQSTAEKPKRYSLDLSAVSTAQLASRLNLAERTVREALVELESAGIAERLGPRSGWRLRARDDAHRSSIPACSSVAEATNPLKGVSL